MRLAFHFLIFAAVVSAADLGQGRELFSQGKYEDAISELRQVVKDEPDNADAHRYLGMALVEEGKAEEATTHLKRAHEIASSGETRLALARLAYAQNDIARAEEMFEGASGAETDYVRGLVHLGRKRYKQAAEALESYIEKNPGHAYPHYYAGLAYNGLRRPDKMLTHFQHFVEMKPDAPEARKVRAVLRTGR